MSGSEGYPAAMPDVLLRGLPQATIDSLKFEATKRAITPGEYVARLDELLQRLVTSASDESLQLLAASRLVDPRTTVEPPTASEPNELEAQNGR
jgi:hypothetical protein